MGQKGHPVLCCAESLSHVQFFATPWTEAHQIPLSVGILQARILKWVAMPFSRGSSQPWYQTQVFHIAGGFFTIQASREALRKWRRTQSKFGAFTLKNSMAKATFSKNANEQNTQIQNNPRRSDRTFTSQRCREMQVFA